MHEPLTNRIEEILRSGEQPPDVAKHLQQCSSCREELSTMQKQSSLLRSLRTPGEFEPSPGFYARVMSRVELQQAGQSIWNLFSESLFAKRLAFASATMFVLLGTLLVSTTATQKSPNVASAPEAIIANDDNMHPAIVDNPQRDRDAVLVSFTSYEQ